MNLYSHGDCSFSGVCNIISGNSEYFEGNLKLYILTNRRSSKACIKSNFSKNLIKEQSVTKFSSIDTVNFQFAVPKEVLDYICIESEEGGYFENMYSVESSFTAVSSDRRMLDIS